MKAGSSHAEERRPTAIIASSVNRRSRQAFRTMKATSPIVSARKTASKTCALTQDSAVSSRNWVIGSTCPRLIHLTRVEICHVSNAAPASANNHVSGPREELPVCWCASTRAAGGLVVVMIGLLDSLSGGRNPSWLATDDRYLMFWR